MEDSGCDRIVNVGIHYYIVDDDVHNITVTPPDRLHYSLSDLQSGCYFIQLHITNNEQITTAIKVNDICLNIQGMYVYHLTVLFIRYYLELPPAATLSYTNTFKYSDCVK